MVAYNVICFFKQKTAYERHIGDWSSDVCSSDLIRVIDDVFRILTHARDTSATADKSLQAVIRAEVQQTIQHKAESAVVALGASAYAVQAEMVDGRTPVTHFGFRTESTEVVTDHAVNIISDVVIDRSVGGKKSAA